MQPSSDHNKPDKPSMSDQSTSPRVAADNAFFPSPIVASTDTPTPLSEACSANIAAMPTPPAQTGDSDTLPTPRDAIAYLLNKVVWRLRRQLSEGLEREGLTAGQWSVLRDLREEEQKPAEERQVSPAQIAERLEQDRATLSGILERLRKRGLITVTPRPEDRRSVRVTLAPEAEPLVASGERLSGQLLDRALRRFEAEETEVLRELLTRMVVNLEQEEETMEDGNN